MANIETTEDYFILSEQLKTLRATHQYMVNLNGAYEVFRQTPEKLEKMKLPALAKQQIRRFKPRYKWHRRPYEDRALSDSQAKIDALQARLAGMEGNAQVEHESGKMVYIYTQHRAFMIYKGSADTATAALLTARKMVWSRRHNGYIRQYGYTNGRVRQIPLQQLPER